MDRHEPQTRTVLGASLAFALAFGAVGPLLAGPGMAGGLPERLSQTGLFADLSTRRIADGNLSYAPQYALWTDGARKRRWIRLPAGAVIDASDPDAWVFPVGTKLWKEFAFAGRPVETRYLERGPDGRWLFAAYVWKEDGSDAVLAPEAGLQGVAEVAPGLRHDVPARTDCLACHEGNAVPVLGFGALQLSPDRDPLAPHAELAEALDLRTLAERGLLRGLPARLLARPPRVPARTPEARAALGYLHGNCAMCHNAAGPLADLGLDLEQRVATPSAEPVPALATPARFFQVPGTAPGRGLRLSPGDPGHSAIVVRLGSRRPSAQMPPLGTKLVDEQAVHLVSRWIEQAGETAGLPAAIRVSSKEE